MALTGIQIFKLLPKTNCKDCGFPTCLAFAMKLAQAQVELSACPHVSEEAREELTEAALPPIRKVRIGVGEDAVECGEETVLFRHDKKFEHPPGIGVLISDDESLESVSEKLNQVNSLSFERVGLLLRPEIVAIRYTGGESTSFLSLVKKVKEGTKRAIVLVCEDPVVMGKAVELIQDRHPLMYGAGKDNAEEFVGLAKKYNCPVGVKGDGLDELVDVSKRFVEAGVAEVVLDPLSSNLKDALLHQTSIRRLALRKKFRPLGFPTISFPCFMTDDSMMEAMYGAFFVAKYAGLIILSNLAPDKLYPLLVQRMNIYTDPQRPMMMKEGIYPIGEPNEKSPILITTNFALTYFIVSGEVESSKVPAHLLIMDCEGLSVLTAWAAGKFVADLIAAFVKKSGIEERIANKRLLIPGYVAQIKGELEEELSDWRIDVGCREASDLPKFLQEYVCMD
jgi:acetyl-CoA decarbonylase/synthase complex subunit gamma